MRRKRLRQWLACCLGRGELAPIGKGDVDELATSVGEMSYAGGTYVFREGDDSARIHVVRSGRLELSREKDGNRITLQILRPGDVFGDVPVLLGQPETFDARAVEDSVVLSFDSDTLYELLRTRPRLAERWLVSLADRTYRFQERLNDLLSGSLESRIASILLREARDGRVAITQQGIADLCGAKRSSVNRVLKNLEAAGVVEVHYGEVELVDAGALAALDQVGPLLSE